MTSLIVIFLYLLVETRSAVTTTTRRCTNSTTPTISHGKTAGQRRSLPTHRTTESSSTSAVAAAGDKPRRGQTPRWPVPATPTDCHTATRSSPTRTPADCSKSTAREPLSGKPHFGITTMSSDLARATRALAVRPRVRSTSPQPPGRPASSLRQRSKRRTTMCLTRFWGLLPRKIENAVRFADPWWMRSTGIFGPLSLVLSLAAALALGVYRSPCTLRNPVRKG